MSIANDGGIVAKQRISAIFIVYAFNNPSVYFASKISSSLYTREPRVDGGFC